MSPDKQLAVAFASRKLESDFEELNAGKFEDKALYGFINRAISDLKKDASCGIKMPKKLWPKEYKQYALTNLWKYDLPNGWRLIYTIKENAVMILSVILEWFCHKDYEKRFKY
ncbi:MAG: hypothetical protein V1820_06340 [archaeon]